VAWRLRQKPDLCCQMVRFHEARGGKRWTCQKSVDLRGTDSRTLHRGLQRCSYEQRRRLVEFPNLQCPRRTVRGEAAPRKGHRGLKMAACPSKPCGGIVP